MKDMGFNYKFYCFVCVMNSILVFVDTLNLLKVMVDASKMEQAFLLDIIRFYSWYGNFPCYETLFG